MAPKIAPLKLELWDPHSGTVSSRVFAKAFCANVTTIRHAEATLLRAQPWCFIRIRVLEMGPPTVEINGNPLLNLCGRLP